MLQRKAQCHCAALTVLCEGDPTFVAMCHCQACQRRTGSAFNLGAWYAAQHVVISGETHIFQRTGEEGMQLSYHFCPACGANVYWLASSMEGFYGIAVGAFADPDFPPPTLSLYEEYRAKWVKVPEGIPCSMTTLSGINPKHHK
ncbi:GFA family protein [Oceanicoccus sp. KOV_DT_Chl]|uniref:GFA family protein n=1 Tax=Oceanicoccus sp. KOV_DT_Chl TaxID=1904639 RepID=UPI000C7D0391|nr:GFA family protein [Oceanicoccus sp. KOV_DT_Chl]